MRFWILLYYYWAIHKFFQLLAAFVINARAVNDHTLASSPRVAVFFFFLFLWGGASVIASNERWSPISEALLLPWPSISISWSKMDTKQFNVHELMWNHLHSMWAQCAPSAIVAPFASFLAFFFFCLGTSVKSTELHQTHAFIKVGNYLFSVSFFLTSWISTSMSICMRKDRIKTLYYGSNIKMPFFLNFEETGWLTLAQWEQTFVLAAERKRTTGDLCVFVAIIVTADDEDKKRTSPVSYWPFHTRIRQE